MDDRHQPDKEDDEHMTLQETDIGGFIARSLSFVS